MRAAGQRHDAACAAKAIAGGQRACKYRDFLTVVLILKDRNVFDDNWIYIHDPSVKVGRIQNFKSWSPEMVPDPTMTLLRPGVFLLRRRRPVDVPDADLIEPAKNELAKIGLAQAGDVVDGCVVRQPKAYPVYDDDYANTSTTIREDWKRVIRTCTWSAATACTSTTIRTTR